MTFEIFHATPTYDQLMVPTIRALKALGGSGTIHQIYEKVLEILDLDRSVVEREHFDSGRSEVEYRLAWSRTYLKKYGLLTNPARGMWSVGDDVDPDKVDPAEIVRYVLSLHRDASEVAAVSVEPGGEISDDTSVDQPEDADWGDYAIDTLLIRNETRTVHEILRRIGKNQFIMNPDFQRDFIWDHDKQSKLIESVLMRIPLPVFYLAEDDQGRMIVVDGLQRLTTFNRFVNNEFSLRLPKQKELDKKRFSDLSPKFQNRVEDCPLILYLIDSKVPDRARLDIFERVNLGVALTRQQMRNCLYMGDATRFLKTESETELFLSATGGSLNVATMRDREFINRFCAFHLIPVSDYKDMDDFLAQALKEMNRPDAVSLKRLSEDFRRSLTNNLAVFGKHAFRKYQPGQDSRFIINASLWDVMSTGLALIPEVIVEENADKLREALSALFLDADFAKSITYSPNSALQVRQRFSKASEMFREVFYAE